MALGQNIRMLRKAQKMPINALARQADASPQAIHNLEKRDSSQSTYIIKLAAALGVSTEDLMTKDFRSIDDAKKFLSLQPNLAQNNGLNDLSSHDEITVTISSATASMGLGEVCIDEEVFRMVRVRKAWLKQALPAFTSIEALGILTARGDSMKPTFNDGDQLIVDCGVREIQHEGVYVISRFGDLFVKRIQIRLQDRAIIIKSDNSAFYEPEIITADDRDGISVLGRVLWAWTGERL